jgi:hypothetical protein
VLTALWPFQQRIPLNEGGWTYLAWGASMAVLCLAGLGVLWRGMPPGSDDLGILIKVTGAVLCGLSLGFAVLWITLISKHTTVVLGEPLFLWSFAMSVVGMIAGVFCLNLPPRTGPAVARFRLLLLQTGAVAGLVTTILGYALYYANRADLLGGLEKWRANPQSIVLPTVAVLGGLVVMFLSLQLARGLERSNPTMRRLMYGFNAVLSALLLIYVLAIPNVLAYAEPFSGRFFGHTFDWTRGGFHSLSEPTIKYLASLTEPLKVTILLPSDSEDAIYTRSMLEAAKSATTKIVEWELIDPQLPSNRKQILKLQAEFGVTDPVGVLIVNADDPKKNVFIPRRDLSKQSMPNPMRPEPVEDYTYIGESAFLNAIASLAEGKVTVYFTQGSGEMSLDPSTDRRESVNSLSVLRGRLQDRKNFEVKPLKLDPTIKSIPEDADAVVIVRPTRRIPQQAVDVLRSYLKERDGKLMALLEPVTQTQGGSKALVQTGLEGLMTEYGVDLGSNRLINIGLKNPSTVLVLANPEAKNSIATTFSKNETVFQGFENVRTVSPATDKQGRQVDSLLLAPLGFGLVKVDNFNVEPDALANELRRSREKFSKAAAREAQSVAVTVTEGQQAPGMPHDPAHSGLFQSKPRMMVFGVSSWVADAALGVEEYSLFSSSLSWLRGRAQIGKLTAPEKKTQRYELGVPEPNLYRLYILPLGLMFLIVVGVGTGVWVVRRR